MLELLIHWLIALGAFALMMLALYLVVRMAVRHAVKDAAQELGRELARKLWEEDRPQ